VLLVLVPAVLLFPAMLACTEQATSVAASQHGVHGVCCVAGVLNSEASRVQGRLATRVVLMLLLLLRLFVDDTNCKIIIVVC
jgi:hypothetical protein